METIKAVIFDMDGVLTETSEMHFLAWKSLAESIGITMDWQFNEQLKGISRKASLEKILFHGGLETKYSKEEKDVLMTEKNNMYIEMIKNFSRENLCEGIIGLLMALKKNNIKVGVASASRSAEMLIGLLDIESYVNYIVDPTTVPGKPDPSIFLKAAEGLNVSPRYCIGIEDAEAGIQSIKAAGMYAVGIGSKAILEQADLIYTTTKDIDFSEIVKNFNNKIK